ncbi:unnamed protein product [Rhodiola kirilowii]
MQFSSSSSLGCNFSFPVCICGTTPRTGLSNEMVDHDRRRRSIQQLQRSLTNDMNPIRGGLDDGGLSRDCCCLPCAAKAA